MRNAILMVFLAVMSGSAAAEWAFVKDNTFDSDYADQGNIRRSVDTAYMSNLVNFDGLRVLGNGQQYLSRKFDQEYDCRHGQSRILRAFWYSEKMGLGRVVANENTPYPWEPFEADAHRYLWKLACNK